jgi:hypothetical protein
MNELYQQWLNTRPDYKPLSKWTSGLIEEVLDRYPTPNKPFSGFVNRTIVGPPGSGKSVYAYKLSAKLHYVLNGYTKRDEEEESYKFALDNFIFYPQDLFDRMLEQKKKRQPALVWCLDDASVHFGKQLFDIDRKIYRRLQGAMPTIRTAVTCLLITTPRTQLLAKPLREFFDYKAEIRVVENFQRTPRIARHYEKKFFPDDTRYRMRIPFQDKYSVLVPEPFFTWYLDKKMDAEIGYLDRSMHGDVVVEPSEKEDEEEDAKL